MKAWPIKGWFSWPQNGPGSFGAVRKFDIHTGVDLYCKTGTVIQAVESGKVVAIEDFTGPKADSPWWNDTQAVLVDGDSGVILYGEIEPSVEVDAEVSAGDEIGKVLQVLKKDKGRPMSMLHFELYKHGTRESVWWYKNEDKPDNLLDPTNLLMDCRTDD